MGVIMDYITKKIPRAANRHLARLKARMEIQEGRRVTEGEVIQLGLIKLEEDLSKKKKYKLKDLIGIAKGGEKSTEEEMDKILYGA